MKEKLESEFRKRYRRDPEQIFFCPGRVNLIGEHIDYNGGKVMPCAISLGTFLAVAPNKENKFRFQAIEFTESADIDIKPNYSKSGSSWYNYPLGVIAYLSNKEKPFHGLDLLYSGNLPIGSGLSSSASIEVLTCFAFNKLFNLGMEKKEMALLSKKVENEFIGVNCGIMDQYAVAMGQQSYAILLDCDKVEHDYIPLRLQDHILAIINTNKPRKLVESKYNERFSECMKALAALQSKLPIQNLCELAPDQLLINKNLINDPVLEKRVMHVVFENDRVKQAAKALAADDLPAFGKLMFASHQSLQELYEVSGKELDTIVEFSRGFDGCTGARMTGAGFGGCAIALVKKDKINDFDEQLTAFYKTRIGYEPTVFSSGAEEGVRQIK